MYVINFIPEVWVYSLHRLYFFTCEADAWPPLVAVLLLVELLVPAELDLADEAAEGVCPAAAGGAATERMRKTRQRGGRGHGACRRQRRQ